MPANAIELSFAALERHPDDYETLFGVLTVFQHLFGKNKCPRIQQNVAATFQQAVAAFFNSHPNLRSVIDNAVQVQQRLHPDDIYVDREAFMVLMAMDMF